MLFLLVDFVDASYLVRTTGVVLMNAAAALNCGNPTVWESRTARHRQ
jgi:hypothetical protein